MLRAEIVATVRATMKEVLEGADEVWLTSKQVSERFPMLNKEWMRHYAKLLPRERAEVTLEDGSVETTHWAYPMHKIQRMIIERKLCNLKSHNRQFVKFSNPDGSGE